MHPLLSTSQIFLRYIFYLGPEPIRYSDIYAIYNYATYTRT